MSEQAGKKVCVTGASGYIASWLVKQLVLRGYSVNATVRDLNDPKKTGHLMALEGAKERLHLFKADLLEEGSFDSAVDGCEGVFHLASPVTADVKDPQAELLDPAVKGTLNVLSSCAKLPFLRRVVLTSSMSAVFLPGRPLTPEVVVDESWFSSAEFCMETKKYYALSKTLAEDAAWKFIKERGIDMVVINPAMVVGPLLQPRLNIGASIIAKLINGAKTYPNLTLCWVHVKDVADAHILAYETPSATGRYILSERVAHLWDLVKLLHEMYPTMQLPNECEGGGPLTPLYQVSKERATSLGITYFIPLEFTLKDAVESLNYNGFASF